ncbi:MAG: T9SS type A sorting domain-containing protein [Flavobacteriaceae bacterium]
MSPNPVTKDTTVQFFLPMEKQVKVGLYDVFGREVALLFEGNAQGAQSIPWNNTSALMSLSSGLYFVSVEFDGKTYATKAIVD